MSQLDHRTPPRPIRRGRRVHPRPRLGTAAFGWLKERDKAWRAGRDRTGRDPEGQLLDSIDDWEHLVLALVTIGLMVWAAATSASPTSSRRSRAGHGAGEHRAGRVYEGATRSTTIGRVLALVTIGLMVWAPPPASPTSSRRSCAAMALASIAWYMGRLTSGGWREHFRMGQTHRHGDLDLTRAKTTAGTRGLPRHAGTICSPSPPPRGTSGTGAGAAEEITELSGPGQDRNQHPGRTDQCPFQREWKPRSTQILDHAKRAEARTDRALSWVTSTPVTLVIVAAVLVGAFWLGLQF